MKTPDFPWLALDRTWLCAMLTFLLLQHEARAVEAAEAKPLLQVVLVEAKAVTSAALVQWKKEQFQAVAIVLTEQADKQAYRELPRMVSENGLKLYWWIEVARNPTMAAAHPRWMASLGSHADWLRDFPKVPEPGANEVAKAFPWVPIVYQETFDAQLGRIDQLLKTVPTGGWEGILLNDLQAGPGSCGCGNLQCRWAVDYFVQSTATKLEGEDVAARFVAEVRKKLGDKAVIPVWTTECEDVDLPASKNKGIPGTGFCGSMACAVGACPDVFTRQWSALASAHDGPIGLLGLHTALKRTQPAFGGGPGWVTNSIAYVKRTLAANGGKPPQLDRLWLVVEGASREEETAARELAAKTGGGAVVVSRVKIDQSYEPRIISTK